MRFHSHFREESEAGHCVVIANANAHDTANYGLACWLCINMRAKSVSAFTFFKDSTSKANVRLSLYDLCAPK